MTDGTIRHDPTESDNVLEVLARVSSQSLKEDIFCHTHTVCLSLALTTILTLLYLQIKGTRGEKTEHRSPLPGDKEGTDGKRNEGDPNRRRMIKNIAGDLCCCKERKISKLGSPS